MASWRTEINNFTTITPPQDFAYIIISEELEDDAYYIFKFNSKDEILFGDYCYSTLEEAKFHCKELYEIDEKMWYECPDLDWSSIKEAKIS